MKYLLIGIIFTLVSNILAKQIIVTEKDPAHPDKCVYEGLVLSPGEEGQVEGKCAVFRCDSADGSGELEDCVEPEISPPCKFVELIITPGPYPGCCKVRMSCLQINIFSAFTP